MHTLPCPPELWPRFSKLLDLALDLPAATRAEWLRALENDDAAVRPWLEQVLRAADGPDTKAFLDRPHILPGAPGAAAPAPDEFLAGMMAGPYRLVAPLGSGGMGEVWQASRDDEGPQRVVALKLPHPGMLAGPFRQRFRRERDVLASLAHPNIAALYDAGVDAAGQPYLALELVTGCAITDYCRQGGATLARRVELLIQMLGALSYAHARLIVHRDIKPSNVMVTPDGAVKLLDFGIAKLLEAPEGDSGPLTTADLRLATAGYAAPEQRGGGPITVAADVFAAGVLLFELCTGARPWALHAGDGEAPTASARVDAASAGLAAGSAAVLRGDLDAVLAKALTIDPARRYESAEAFAQDLRNWHAGLPVSARRITRWARAGKAIRRRPAAWALAGVLAVSLVGGSAGIAWQAHRAAAAAARSDAVVRFMTGLFEQAGPRNGPQGAGMTARQLLDAGADRAEAAFGADPRTEMAVLDALGGIYDALDDRQRAEQSRSRWLQSARALYGPADRRVIEGTLVLAESEAEFGDEDKALPLLAALRGPLFRRYGTNSVERAEWLYGHAEALRVTHGSRDDAMADDQAAIGIFEHGHKNSPHYPETVLDLAGYQYDAEQYAASLASLDKAKAIELAAHQHDGVDELIYVEQSALRLERLGRFAAANSRFVAAEAMAQQQLGPDNLWFQHALIAQAQMWHLHGQRDVADRMFEAAAVSIRNHAGTAQATNFRRAYGMCLTQEGRPAEAVPLLEAALTETRLHVHDEANLRRTEMHLGDAYDQIGRTGAARRLLKDSRDSWMQYGAGQVQALAARERWARFLLDHGDKAGAAGEFRALLAQAGDRPSAPAALAQAGLARIALANGAKADADAASGRAVAILAKIDAEHDVRTAIDVALVRATSLFASGHPPQALAVAQGALAQAMGEDAPQSPRIARARALVKEIGPAP